MVALHTRPYIRAIDLQDTSIYLVLGKEIQPEYDYDTAQMYESITRVRTVCCEPVNICSSGQSEIATHPKFNRNIDNNRGARYRIQYDATPILQESHLVMAFSQRGLSSLKFIPYNL